ncbi:hypothetical protein LACWKB10_0687 [Lactobacillus sp. wkB10]|nr:hypothetical protein LACWKB10_0687 [Lactobacillus sp. wkB10]
MIFISIIFYQPARNAIKFAVIFFTTLAKNICNFFVLL